MSLFDTHCHLTYDTLAEDPDGAWERALAAGVSEAVVVAIDAASAPRVLAFVERHAGLYAALGVHPNEVAAARPGDLETLAELAGHPKVVAIGESGLDTYWDRAPIELQRDYLERHVALALERDLPLILHLRDTYPLAAEVLAPHAAAGLRGIIHCFAGAGDEADPFIEWGWPISFSGILTYPQAENVRAAARRTPFEQCLVETDSPWLTPRGYGKRPNEPAFVVATAERLAEEKGVSKAELARVTTATARRVFGLRAIVPQAIVPRC